MTTAASSAAASRRGSASRGPRIAYQGEPGAFSEEAIVASFGERTLRVPCETFEAVATALRTGAADLAMLPVENSTIGPIHESRAVIERYSLVSTAEHTLPVRLCLLAIEGANVEDIAVVRSHPAALAQCRRFLDTHPQIRAESVHDTAGAARELAATRDVHAAAIAGRIAAARYGLAILATDVQDTNDNRTRFNIVKCGPDTLRTGAVISTGT